MTESRVATGEKDRQQGSLVFPDSVAKRSCWLPGSRARDVSRELWGNGSLAAGGLQHLISQPQFSYLQNRASSVVRA